MAPPPGTRDRQYDDPAGGFLTAVGRLAGFCLLAGMAVAIFAAALLLPEYGRTVQAEYELARQQAVNTDLESLIQAHRRLIEDLPSSPVLTKRLAMNQLGLWPADELVVAASDRSLRPPPGMVITQPHPRPSQPDGKMLDLAQRLSKPRTRRGLFLLAAAALLAAIFLFPTRNAEPTSPAAN